MRELGQFESLLDMADRFNHTALLHAIVSRLGGVISLSASSLVPADRCLLSTINSAALCWLEMAQR